ncbi:monooxygenase 2-like [Pistacia vera]|uniref:monooxygenase 2-like n=1 Tax=Pistacia vera TaxID=55513 RepID=UPI001263D6B4|nr:monooxygenase 2-like [Pistacia vera]
MEASVGDILIVGAGIAGLTTSLGLHRLGIRSLVLESSDTLRETGFAFTTWNNAWKALDVLGIGDSLRQPHQQLQGMVVTSTISRQPPSERSLKSEGKLSEREIRCVRRKLLLEALVRELPIGTIRFSSNVVSVEESGYFKLVHLADGSILKTKIDGVNSVVAKWLGLKKPDFAGRSAIRGYSDFKCSHGLEPEFLEFLGKGVKSGFPPCDDQTVYWFFTWSTSSQDKELASPAEMKQFVLSKFNNLPDKVKAVLENTPLESIISSPLRYRHPWEVLWGNISKGNVCVAGDALHPMTPDLGQGACSALEDGIVLARCIAEALTKTPCRELDNDEFRRIEMGLNKFAKERRWRSFQLISTAYVVGFIHESKGKIMTFLRDKILPAFLTGVLIKRADFDCGELSILNATASV